jgi:hypothetical protein
MAATLVSEDSGVPARRPEILEIFEMLVTLGLGMATSSECVEIPATVWSRPHQIPPKGLLLV